MTLKQLARAQLELFRAVQGLPDGLQRIMPLGWNEITSTCVSPCGDGTCGSSFTCVSARSVITTYSSERSLRLLERRLKRPTTSVRFAARFGSALTKHDRHVHAKRLFLCRQKKEYETLQRNQANMSIEEINAVSKV
jgi:hypothetical protein